MESERLEAFAGLRFGMFIHWNSATFQFARRRGDWCYGVTDNASPRYRPFAPEGFDPGPVDFQRWADVANSAGCRFCALTAKHHEGFALWPSGATRHSVAASPYRGDVVAGYVQAMRANGLLPGLYFSMLDLHHNITERGVDAARKALIHRQLEELLTHYGEIPILVIDGWGSKWGGPRFSQLDYGETAARIHALSPNTLILNHSCECSTDHTDVIFFENAAGQRAPRDFAGYGAAGNKLTPHWVWKAGDAARRCRGAAGAVEKKLRPMNARGVVFLLNASPNQSGAVEDNQARVFAEIGRMTREEA
ncbi:MAG: alpha-L-fucosidase [Oscillospiraceae bacterium]|jgi:alpha-L-fucosidase|nr:alpha-L-fucosidase [Oscillospiraceae bacterium]